MSSRYSRPHTPPGPPPSQGSRKSSGRKLPSSSVSSKAPPSRSYDDHHSYDKTYTKSSSSSSYPPPKAYSDDKYKSSSVRKVGSEKVPNNSSSSGGGSKYPGKGDTYSSESSREYKATREVHYPSADRYSSKDPHLHHHHPYLGSSYSGEKARYSDKYLAGSSPPPPYGDAKYAGKKYADEYDPYPSEKSTGRYSSSSSLRHEGSAYYSSGSLAPYSSFSSYSSYSTYGSSYGNRGGTGSYGVSDKLSYETDKLTPSSYSSLDKLSQVPLHPRDKLASGGYSDTKMGPRSRLYPDDSRRPYRDYTPPPTCSTRSPLRGVSSSSYGNYGHYSPPRSPQRQYLNRYVIGDSVVYGPPGHYPRDLRSTSPRIRPPSPPSPQPLVSRNYSRYPASPRRYPSSNSRRTPPASSSQYRSPSPAARRAASPRRPPSPPPRRPPSPRSPQLRSSYRGSREQSFERARSKDRYVSKGSAGRSPTRDSRGTAISRSELNSRPDRDKRKEPERRLAGSREKTHDGEPSKRARTGERNSDYHHSGSRGWASKETTTAASSNHLSSTQKDRRPRSPPLTSRSNVRTTDLSRDRRREDSREKDKSRRIEDRLGPSPSQASRRSPALRSRAATRRAGSPRDKRSSRRHPDLRLWIESRKSESGKRLASPSSRSRPVTKRVARSSERSTVTKRTRLGDPKRRLGGYKTRRRALPLKRNKILKKYQRLTAKRGANKASSSSARLSNRENGGSRGDGGDEGSKGREDGGGGGDGPRPPGSSATIRRVIKKPKVLSLVNRMVLKPRVIRKPTQKLLKDPKEDMKAKEKSHSDSQQSTRDTSKSDEKQSVFSSPSASITANSINASSSTTATTAATTTSSSTFESSKRSTRSTTAPTSATTTTTTSSS